MQSLKDRQNRLTFEVITASTPCLKNVAPLAGYNFDTHEWILVFLAEMLPIK